MAWTSLYGWTTISCPLKNRHVAHKRHQVVTVGSVRKQSTLCGQNRRSAFSISCWKERIKPYEFTEACASLFLCAQKWIIGARLKVRPVQIHRMEKYANCLSIQEKFGTVQRVKKEDETKIELNPSLNAEKLGLYIEISSASCWRHRIHNLRYFWPAHTTVYHKSDESPSWGGGDFDKVRMLILTESEVPIMLLSTSKEAQQAGRVGTWWSITIRMSNYTPWLFEKTSVSSFVFSCIFMPKGGSSLSYQALIQIFTISVPPQLNHCTRSRSYIKTIWGKWISGREHNIFVWCVSGYLQAVRWLVKTSIPFLY